MAGDQRLIDQQSADTVGSPDLPTAIYGRLVLRVAFDKAVNAITVSDEKVSGDLRTVVKADAAVETALEDLLANTNVLSDYNAQSSLLATAIGHFATANAVALADFGVAATHS